MHFPTLMTVFVLTTLLGCGADISSNRARGREGRTETVTPDEGSLVINSQIHRSRGQPVLTYAQEMNQIISDNLPAQSYRIIPNMFVDDEGTNGQNVTTVNGRGRPQVICGSGNTFSGIDARINDCLIKNGESSALWSGFLNASSGEGSWQLVALTTQGKEVWLDNRTNMVWSDIVATANWCKASGNKQTTTVGTTIDCEAIGEDESLCVGASTAGIGINIKWRLPTRNDFLQADINGLRFVAKPGNINGSWTATMQAASLERAHAWVYRFSDGTLSPVELSEDRQVRCIGSAIR